jgi:hypothetical protein
VITAVIKRKNFQLKVSKIKDMGCHVGNDCSQMFRLTYAALRAQGQRHGHRPVVRAYNRLGTLHLVPWQLLAHRA